MRRSCDEINGQVSQDKPIFIDLFCGAGGASEGLVAAGLGCFLAVDIDPVALASHKTNHPGAHHILMDMTRPAVRWGKLMGRVDLVHGSPPCQNLSCANRAKDLDVALVTLRAFEEAVKAVQPRWFTMENVPQVRSHLNELYKKVRLFNCADYGVPQTRKRVFAGNFPDPKPTHARNGPLQTLTGDRLEKWISFGAALGLEGYVNTNRGQRPDGTTQERPVEEPAPTFTTKAGSQWNFVDKSFQNVRRRSSVHSADRPSTTITTAASRREVLPPGPPLSARTLTTRNMGSQTNDGLWLPTDPGENILLVSKNTISGKKGTRLTRAADEPAFTLTTHQGGVNLYPGSGEPGVGECRAVPRDIGEPSHTLVVKPPSIRSRGEGRQLSEQECAALQSFPPGYIFLGNKTERQRQIGNAVPPKMAEAIGRVIREEYGDK